MTTDTSVIGDDGLIVVDYQDLVTSAKIGNKILIADGQISLSIKAIHPEKRSVTCVVNNTFVLVGYRNRSYFLSGFFPFLPYHGAPPSAVTVFFASFPAFLFVIFPLPSLLSYSYPHSLSRMCRVKTKTCTCLVLLSTCPLSLRRTSLILPSVLRRVCSFVCSFFLLFFRLAL